MHFINIGSLHVQLEWIFLGISSLLSLLILKFYIRKIGVDNKKFIDNLWNGIFILIIIWKFSLIIFQTKLVIQSPLSLLYFTGGEKGIWLGIVIAFIYMLWRTKNGSISITTMINFLIIFGLCDFGLFHLLSIYLMEDLIHHLLVGGSALAICFTIMKYCNVKKFKPISYYLVIFAIGQLLLSYVFGVRTINQTIFSDTQWVLIALGIVGIIGQFLEKEAS